MSDYASGPCPTRLDNQPTASARPWHYGHAASIEGAHWDIYAGEGIDGWLVGMTTTEADAALIVQAVNAAAPAEGLDVDPCPHCDMQHVWPCPTIPRCDEPGCEKATSCGFPTDTGYRRTCGDHYRAAEASR